MVKVFPDGGTAIDLGFGSSPPVMVTCGEIQTEFGFAQMAVATDGAVFRLTLSERPCLAEKTREWQKSWTRTEFSPGGKEVKSLIAAIFSDSHAKGPIKAVATGTRFQIRIWQQLMTVPYGQTISYSELAKMARIPKGARATGNAVGANPLIFIIPCHRVIRANGGIGGFGCGPEIKKRLLARENSKAFFP